MPEELLIVGTVLRPHGMDGEVQVQLSTDAPEVRFKPGSRLTPLKSGEEGNVEELTVKTVRPHTERLLVSFEEVPDRDAAERLAPCELGVPEGSNRTPARDYFRVDELLECVVSAPPHFERCPVVELRESGAQPLAVIRLDSRRTLLLPLHSDWMVEYDESDRHLRIDLPEGWKQMVRTDDS